MGFRRVRGNWSPERLVLAIPTLALGTVVLAFALGGGRRPFGSAQIYGGPTDVPGAWSGRVLVVREESDELEPFGALPVEVVRRGAKSEARVRGRTAPDGWMEVTLPPHQDPPFGELEVRSLVDGALLAQGSPVFPLERWARAPRRGLSAGHRRRAGLSIQGAVLAVPFPSKLELTPLGCTEAGTEAASFEGEWLRVSGATVTTERLAMPTNQLELSGNGRFSLELRPSEHVVGFERGCDVQRDEPKVSLTMPIVPGALHVKISGADLLVEAPTEAETIWYTFVTETARLSSGRLELKVDATGTPRGLLPQSTIPGADGLYLVLATSPDGRSPSTVGYPLAGQATTFDAVDGFLVDGGPAARAREGERRRRVVRALLGYVAVLFTLSLWLFRLVVRRSDQRLVADLRRGEAPAGLLMPPPRRSSLVAGMTIALGLSLVLLWIAVFEKAG